MAAKGKVFVQFWLRPGEQEAAFEVGNEPLDEMISDRLRKFYKIRTFAFIFKILIFLI